MEGVHLVEAGPRLEEGGDGQQDALEEPGLHRCRRPGGRVAHCRRNLSRRGGCFRRRRTHGLADLSSAARGCGVVITPGASAAPSLSATISVTTPAISSKEASPVTKDSLSPAAAS